MMMADIEALIDAGESATVEWKKSTGQRSEAAKTVCAMLNGDGGHVLFGVAPDGKPVGQQVADRTLRNLTGEIARIEPAPVVEVETVPVDAEGHFAVIIVHVPGRTGLFTFDGRPYVRRGPTTSVMPAHQYELRVAEKLHANVRWENQPAAGLSIADLDADAITRCVRAGQRVGRLPERLDADIPAVLQRFHLLDEAGAILNGAVALFARRERLTAHYMQLGIRLARFRGRTHTADFSDNRQYEGNIFELLGRAEEFLLDHVPIASEVGTGAMVRTDLPAYPPAATREALANALCHRDYATAGDTVGVAMFDDRLEISSPGGLHFGLTTHDLLRPHPSRPWNPLIATVLYRAGVIEQWGTGTTRIAEICAANGNPSPAWGERAGTLVILFRPLAVGAPQTSGAVTPQVTDQVTRQVPDKYPTSTRQVLAALQAASGPLPRAALQEVTGLANREHFVNEHLRPLLRASLIEMTIPEKPRSSKQKYRLTALGRKVLETMADGPG